MIETASRWVEGGPVLLDQVHRFVGVSLDDNAMPVTGLDADYAELSLLLRDGTDPEAVAARLVRRGALVAHPSRDAAVGALAADIAASLDRGRSNTDRPNTDRPNTDRPNTDRPVRAGLPLGSSLGGPGGAGRRVLLEPDCVAGAVQLGYAPTDYGNQGVTADRSITWVCDATTAGGLYVGATRGREHNAVHVVAPDLDAACEQIVAAAGRHRADRGLDAARAAVETVTAPDLSSPASGW